MGITKHAKRSADEQRKMFGYPVFGRKNFSYDLATDKWCASYKVCFGLDSNYAEFTSVKVWEMAKNKQKAQF